MIPFQYNSYYQKGKMQIPLLAFLPLKLGILLMDLTIKVDGNNKPFITVQEPKSLIFLYASYLYHNA